MAPALRAWVRNWKGENSVRNLQYMYVTDLELSKEDPFELKFVFAYLGAGQKVFGVGVGWSSEGVGH